MTRKCISVGQHEFHNRQFEVIDLLEAEVGIEPAYTELQSAA